MENSAIIWFVSGVLLILSEFVLPGVILMFFGVAAILVSIVVFVGLADGLGSQLVIFSALSLVLLFSLRKYFKSWFVGASKSAGNGGGEVDLDEFQGKEVTVVEPIPAGGYGKVELKGASWKASSEAALGEGDLVEVVRRDGLTLHVAARG